MNALEIRSFERTVLARQELDDHLVIKGGANEAKKQELIDIAHHPELVGRGNKVQRTDAEWIPSCESRVSRSSHTTNA